jgi:hypothetical protein
VRQMQELTPLLAPLAAIQRLLAHFDDRALIIGGVAASLLGKPRLTADVDVVIFLSIEDLPRLMDTAIQEGLVPRINDAYEFARRHRVLLLRHRESGINVDVSLGALPFESEAIERGKIHLIGPVAVRLPTPEDLIIFKAVAHRPKDLLDIQAIIESQPDLDRGHIELWVREFAQFLEMPEIWGDIAQWLQPSDE